MQHKIVLLKQMPNINKEANIIFICTAIILLIIIFSYKTYDTLNIVGIYKCEEKCFVETSLSYDEINIIDKDCLIEYKNEKYKINNINHREPYLSNNIPYEDLIIETKLNTKNSLVKIKILYNKQRIAKKLINIIRGKE